MRRYRFLLLGALSIALIGGAAGAAEFIYMGHGTRTCADWKTDRRAPSITKVADEAWILGFLSGVGSTGYLQQNPLRGVANSNVIFIWVDNYCRAHPDEDIEKAGEAFVRQHPRLVGASTRSRGFGRQCRTKRSHASARFR